MGLSSRPKFTLNDTTQVVEFFIDSIEKWRVAAGLKRFHIMGHSLGGYLATHYALKYPENVLKVSLISPAGITKHLEDVDVAEFLKTLSFSRRMMFKLFMSYWDKKSTPQSAFKALGFVGRGMLSRYINGRFKRPKEESEILYNYFLNVLVMPESSEKAVHSIFKPPRARAQMPLEEFMMDMDMPVDFYFGEQDWMDWTGAKRICDSTNGRCKFFWVREAGHHINMENPDMLGELVLRNSEGEIVMEEDMIVMEEVEIVIEGEDVAMSPNVVSYD